MLAAVFALAACGGGGSASTPPATLPATLVVTAPGAQQAVGAAVSFGSNAADTGLTYRWDFGDGTTSTEAAPVHTYARAGVFSVRLVVASESTQLSAATTLSVADFAIVAGLACSGAASAGWCWQQPLPQGNAIADTTFIDDVRGWAVGDAGSVLATADGGLTWTAQHSGTPLALARVRFVDARTGWVAGSYGEVLRTTDGGATWQRSSFGRNDAVQDFGAESANAAWLTTFSNEGFTTHDGGITWRKVPPAPQGTFKLAFAGVDDVWSLASFFTAQPMLAHSVEGGATWVDVPLPAIEPGLAGYSNELLFADPSHALLVGYESGYATSDPTTFVARQTLRVTADRGATWQPVALPPGNGSLASLSFVAGNTLFALSFDNLQRSDDFGASWQRVPLPALLNAGAASFRAITAQRLIVTDYSARIWLSIDGGAHWALRGARGEVAAGLNSVWFFDSREGLATGDDGRILRTADGGKTWAATPGAGPVLRRLQFTADGSIGWSIVDGAAIARSTDRGRTWLVAVPGTSARLDGVTDFHFVDALHGWAVSPYVDGSGSAVFRSVDGGASWQRVAGTSLSFGYVAIRFADALHGVAVGPAGFTASSSDGGLAWTPRPTGVPDAMRRVKFLDASTAVAVGEGGRVLRSIDAGQSWLALGTPGARTLNDVQFVSAAIGHAVGDGGTALVTGDGGLSWVAQSTGTGTSLQAVSFIDEQTGWITGFYGNLLATATGGR